ncbi:MAG: GntR family transcriptional regulator [Planctomycetota bacterium]
MPTRPSRGSRSTRRPTPAQATAGGNTGRRAQRAEPTDVAVRPTTAPPTAGLPLAFSRALPSYALLDHALRDAIIARRLAPGARLPEERELARQFQVSRGTVRRALAALEAAGLVLRQQGRGTYVAEPETLPAVPLAVIFQGGAARAQRGFPGEIFQALLETAAQEGVELLLRETAGQRAAVEPGGYIFILPTEPGELRRLGATGLPVVAVDCLVQGPGVDSILFDNVQAGLEAGRMLIAAGHRRIAWIDPQLDRQAGQVPESNAPARLAGLRQALSEANLPPATIWPLALDANDIRRDLPKVLVRHPEVTALCAFDETVAWGAWQAARDLGWNLPTDLSITTLRLLDGPPVGGIDWSGWGARIGDMGRMAVDRVLTRALARAESGGDMGVFDAGPAGAHGDIGVADENARGAAKEARVAGGGREPDGDRSDSSGIPPPGSVLFTPHRLCTGTTVAAPQRGR